MDSNRPNDRRINASSLIVGALLIIIGVLFLLARFFDLSFGIDLAALGWPFFVIIPGLLLFLVALTMEGTSGAGMASIGSIVTMTGLLLFVQNATGLWATWAYAWALIFPTAIGLGQIVYGGLKGHDNLVRAGLNMTLIGLAIFLVGAVFFELLIGISGLRTDLAGVLFPALLIGLGILVLVRNLFSRPARRERERTIED